MARSEVTVSGMNSLRLSISVKDTNHERYSLGICYIRNSKLNIKKAEARCCCLKVKCP